MGGGGAHNIKDAICISELNADVSQVDMPNIKKSFSFFKSITHYIYGGGGLFPEENPRGLLKTWIQFICARLAGTRICFYGIEINPINKKLSKIIWKQLIFLTDFVITRNKQTYQLLIECGCKKQKVICSSDVIFSLYDEQELKILSNVKTMLWAPNNLFRKSEIKDSKVKERYMKICRQLAEICDLHTDYYHVFLPFHSEFDVPYIKDITKLIKKSRYEIVDTSGKNPIQLRTLFKQADFVMCFRFHSVLFSLFYAKPFIAMSYSPKTTELLNEIGLEHSYEEFGIRESNFFGKAFDLDLDNFKKKIYMVVENANNDVERRHDISNKLKQKAQKGEDLLLKWIQNS